MLILPAQAQAVLSKSAYWQRLEAASRSFADEFRDWTAVGRRLERLDEFHQRSPAHPSYVTSFQFPGMAGGRPALKIRRRKQKQKRDWNLAGDWGGVPRQSSFAQHPYIYIHIYIHRDI